MILLVDLGNTRLKWGGLENGQLAVQGSFEHGGSELATLLNDYDGFPDTLDGVYISNVAGNDAAETLVHFFDDYYALKPEIVQVGRLAFGVVNSYENPERLGVDRWIAIVGAHEMTDEAVCVVDFGTATTIDAIDRDGVHVGGLIAPGYRLMLESLTRGTSDLEPAMTRPQIDADGIFAVDSLPAMRHGTALAIAALVDRAVAEFERSVDGRTDVLVTGGDADFLAPLIEHECQVIPDLTLRGLALFAES